MMANLFLKYKEEEARWKVAQAWLIVGGEESERFKILSARRGVSHGRGRWERGAGETHSSPCGPTTSCRPPPPAPPPWQSQLHILRPLSSATPPLLCGRSPPRVHDPVTKIYQWIDTRILHFGRDTWVLNIIRALTIVLLILIQWYRNLLP